MRFSSTPLAHLVSLVVIATSVAAQSFTIINSSSNSASVSAHTDGRAVSGSLFTVTSDSGAIAPPTTTTRTATFNGPNPAGDVYASAVGAYGLTFDTIPTTGVSGSGTAIVGIHESGFARYDIALPGAETSFIGANAHVRGALWGITVSEATDVRFWGQVTLADAFEETGISLIAYNTTLSSWWHHPVFTYSFSSGTTFDETFQMLPNFEYHLVGEANTQRNSGDPLGTVTSYSYNLEVLSAIPEPATYALLVGAFGLALALRRRTRYAKRFTDT